MYSTIEEKANKHEICPYLTEKEYQQLLLDEAAFKEHLEEEAKTEKERAIYDKELEEFLKAEQAHDELFRMEFEEDHIIRIFKSVFVSNFPDSFRSRDMWKLCEPYGKVVDVFIPNRKSKDGKRFAFVRFIKVDDLERLIGNLCTLWVGRFHLHANAACYERHINSAPSVWIHPPHNSKLSGSYVAAVNGSKSSYGSPASPPSPSALVLDDTCINECDFSRHVMAAINDFVCDERVVWVDIEGIPLNVWSHATFLKIGKKWGACNDNTREDDIHSEDPFGFYDLLNKPFKDADVDSSPSLSHPLGFTLEAQQQKNIPNVSSPLMVNNDTFIPEKEYRPNVFSKVHIHTQDAYVNESSSGFSTSKFPHIKLNEDSILDVLDDMIKVGQSMGYDMEGCSKDIERIIGLQGADFATSDSVGNSDGILCAWEDPIFKKECVSVSDNFIALYGTWLSINAKVLIFVVYAPQSPVLKRTLWDYILGLISRWKGETIVMGDLMTCDLKTKDGDWHTDPTMVKDLFEDYFATSLCREQANFRRSFHFERNSSWCKRKKKQALVFKVDTAKAYDFVRWDFLLDVLHAFGFSPNWCKWIRASGLKINVQKSQVLGVGVYRDVVNQDSSETKITWVAWNKTLASKKNGGLGVSSFHALNRALLLKWTGSSLDDLFLPSMTDATRWVKYIPVKVNVFVWRARLDRLPTRGNLVSRGVFLDSSLCPVCGLALEDVQHVFFRCDMAKLVFNRICRWWDLHWVDVSSFEDWDVWFGSIRLSSKLKIMLEGVFYLSWWFIWSFRNRSIFDEAPPRRSVLFDDIVSRSFFWCINRCRSSFSSKYWLKNPYLIAL
nr:RNA-directed DNA polymerase, eukaryota [Tanacetum cinerariifolium]